MLKEIISRENQIIKLIKALKDRNGRKKYGLFFIEGLKIVEEAAFFVPERIHYIILNKSFAELYKERLKEYSKNFECIILPDSLFKEISDTKTPQGILAVLKIKQLFINDFSFKNEHIIILDSVRDPGNIGTIIRTAEAMGFDSIFLTKGCTDIYSPKVTRSTMGSIFRTRIYENCLKEDICLLKKQGYSIISAALKNNSIFLNDINTHKKSAIVIGNEADGISDDLISISDIIVKVPMKGKTESLNAAVAAAIIMYHFAFN